MKIVAAILMLAASPTNTAFNLSCDGQWLAMDTTAGYPKRDTMTFRVNLSENLWCSGACSETAKVFSASDHEIWLDNTTYGRGAIERIKISRDSGRLVYLFNEETFIGECKPQPFTGFPVPKF